MKKIIFSISIIALLLTSNSCNNKAIESPVPNIPFDITLNLTLPLYEPLLHPMSGIVFVNGGSKGIAILRTGPETFAVFDRHCPFQVADGCIVQEDPDNIAALLDETCCGSLFNMVNGGLPDSGPATTGLRSYKYTFNGSILRIYN